MSEYKRGLFGLGGGMCSPTPEKNIWLFLLLVKFVCLLQCAYQVFAEKKCLLDTGMMRAVDCVLKPRQWAKSVKNSPQSCSIW